MPLATALRLLVVHLPVDPDLDDRVTRPLDRRVVVALIAIGGSAGSLCRGLVQSSIGGPVTSGAELPWDTLSVNLVGSLLLGYLLAWLHEVRPTARVPRPLLGTGFCGGFTTFSTFAVEVTVAGRSQHVAVAVPYLVASVLGSVLAAAVGVLFARVVARAGNRERWLRRVRHAARAGKGGDDS